MPSLTFGQPARESGFYLRPCGAQQATVEGQTIAQVRVVDETGKPVTEETPKLPLEAGKTFDFAEERESLRKLYAMGDYRTSAWKPQSPPGWAWISS